jgi:hypothetical protein
MGMQRGGLMKVWGGWIRVAFIVFLWLVSSGSLIKGYYFISFFSAFLGVWLIAMPDHYKRNRQNMAWIVVGLVTAVLLVLLYWRGM